jgi:hypothetical protein
MITADIDRNPFAAKHLCAAATISARRACCFCCTFPSDTLLPPAREAGLSVGQLYRIFASKEAIIEAIVSEIVNARVRQHRRFSRQIVVLIDHLADSGVDDFADNCFDDRFLAGAGGQDPDFGSHQKRQLSVDGN